MDLHNPYETIQRILDGHRRGHYDLQQTVNLLEAYTIQQPEQTRQQTFDILWSALSTEPLEDRPRQGHIVPSVHAIVIRAIAQFGPTAELPARVFGLLRWNDPAAMDFWARTICTQLSYSMFHYASRFPQATLDQAKAFCAPYTFAQGSVLTGTQFPESVVNAAANLAKTIEHIEYSRFAASLQQMDPAIRVEVPELERLLRTLGFPDDVAFAMKKAHEHLETNGQFEPKTAADLIRASIDEIHRAVAAELVKLTGTQCQNPGKDGGRRAYMREVGFISQAEEEFFSSIYTFLSKEGAHKLTAEKETVLFMETMVRDYLLLLLRRLQARRTAPPTEFTP